MAAKEDIQIAKSLVAPLIIGTIAIVFIALLGRAMTSK